MEFKEFSNPEQQDYDVKVGVKSVPPVTVDDITKRIGEKITELEDGIDLNALSEVEIPSGRHPTKSDFYIDEFGDIIKKEHNPNFEINEFGEIIRKNRTK